ncbi:MAG TPA: FAD-dependent oxidoreductase [Actinomycetota bacterium]|nr:FAD-dependent oxidoreductase [Actinomycetota bacterium]
MTLRIVVVGGGAAGIGAAGSAHQVDPEASVTVYTEFEDVGYSPCGIPYVHGKEIPKFENLFLQDKAFYERMGLDIRYETRVSKFDLAANKVTVEGEGDVPFDRLVVATGFYYGDPGVAGTELEGLYYVKNIRQAMEWDKVFDNAKKVVVVEATPLGLEMVTAMAHRGLETHLVDPHPWALAEVSDPDIMKPVMDSWSEMGVISHYNTKVEAFLGDGKVRAVKTSEGELEADVVVICTNKQPNNRLAREAGLNIGSTGGIVVNERMQTSNPNVYAAGDCCELPHGISKVPIQGLSGSHAYAQGKVAGTNAAGGSRAYQPVYVPWGMVAGKWMIGGVSFGETLANALGIPFVMGVAQGISRARYYPDMKPVRVKLLADPGSHKIIGAQLVGGEGIKERCDFLAMAAKTGITLEDLATMENVYSPPIGALNEPIALAAQNGLSNVKKS